MYANETLTGTLDVMKYEGFVQGLSLFEWRYDVIRSLLKFEVKG